MCVLLDSGNMSLFVVVTLISYTNIIRTGKLAEDKRVEEMRAAARARRAAKEEEKQKQEQKQVQESDTVKSSPSTNKSGVGSVADLERKLAQGLKLSHKGKLNIFFIGMHLFCANIFTGHREKSP